MDLPRDYISYSQINTYQSCPRKYFYSYIEERDVPLNEKILLGVVFHSTLESYFKDKIKGNPPEKNRMVQIFRDQFMALCQENEVIWEESREDVENRGIRFVEYFLAHLAPVLKPLMVERELQARIEKLDVTLKGIIDLVEQNYSITDFKTTTSRWSSSRMKRSYLQMVIYKYLFEQNFETRNPELKLKILYSTNKKKVGHQEVVLRSADTDPVKMFDIIQYVVDNIRNEMFYKNESFLCGFCEFRTFCVQSK